MKFQKITGKLKELFGKIGAKTLIAACAVLALAGAAALNFILRDRADGTEIGRLAVDLSSEPRSSALIPQEAEDTFASISLQRKQARDEALEVLKTVSESETALEEAKQAALTDIDRLAMDIEREADIEALVESRGFAQCVAVLNEDKCSLVVESDGLGPDEAAQISEIVYEQAGILPENLKIIERNG